MIKIERYRDKDRQGRDVREQRKRGNRDSENAIDKGTDLLHQIINPRKRKREREKSGIRQRQREKDRQN